MNSMNEKQFIETLGLFAKKGYQIIKDPKNQEDLPQFLHPFSYYPDFIIKSDSINYIIELSTSKNFKNKERLEKIIEEIEKHKAWKFIMVQAETVTEDDKKTRERPEKIIEKVEKHRDRTFDIVQTDIVMEDVKPEEKDESVKKGYRQLKSVLKIQQFEKHQEFILLYAWVLVESMLRTLIGKKEINNDIKLLLKEAVSQGIIDNSENLVLNDLQLLNHELSNGNFEIIIDKSQLDPLIKIANKLHANHFSK